MSNSRSQINSNFYQIANADPVCGNITGINVGTVQATGNITAAYFFGNGSGLTGVTSSINYSNANVAAYLPTYTGNLASSSDIIALYANAVAQENEITALQAAQYSNANVAAYLPTYTGNLAASSDIIALYANAVAQENEISALQAAQYSNANVANYLQVLTSNVTTTANISGAYILGNGRFLTGLPAGYSNADVANYLPTYTGNLASSSDIIALYANAAAQSNAIANLEASAYSNANVANYLQVLTTDVVTTANVQASYLIGNIRNTTGGYNDTNVAAYLPTYLGNLQSGNLLVVNSAVIQGNLTVLGNTTTINANTLNINDKDITVANGALTAAEANGAGLIVGQGNLANIIFNNPANAWTLYPGIDTPGNISGSYILGNITQATGYIVYGNANVAAYLPTYTGNLSNSSDIIALYANAAAQGNAIINIDSNIANLYANAASQSNAIANLQASAYSNANVAAYLPTYTGNLALSSDIIALYANAGTQANAIANLQSNVSILQGNVVDINSNIANLYANAAVQSNAIANLQSAQYSNANVANYLPIYQGNISAGNITVTNNVAANFITATFDITAQNINVSQDIQASNYYGGNITVTETVGANNIVATEDVSSNTMFAATLLTVGGQLVGGDADFGGNVLIGTDVIATGNITAAYYTGNGYYLSGIQASNIVGAYGNANVSNFLANGFGSNTIVTTGNITANYYFGNGAFLSGLNVNYSNANVANYLPTYSGNLGYVTVEALVSKQGIFANAGIEVNGLVLAGSFAGNGRNLFGIAYSNITGAYGNSNVASYLGSNSNVTIATTGNVSAGYFLGNGALLSGINANYSNANVANYLPTYNGNLGYVTVEALVSKQDIFANAGIEVNGLVLAGSFAGNGRNLFGIAYSNITGAYSNTNVAAYLPTYTGALPSLTGNVITTANVQGAYVLGNGAFLTGLPATYSNANVAAYLPTYTGNLAASSDIIALYANAAAQSNAIANIASNVTILQGNIITINSNIANLYANAATQSNAIANLQAAQYSNANVANYLEVLTSNVTTSANIAGNYILGNGAFLTGITAGSTYSNANVANYLQVLSSNVTTTANIQANYFIGNGSQLTDVSIAITPAVVDFTFTGEASNGAVTDEFVNYTFSSDYLNGNGNVIGTTWTRYTTAASEKAAASDTGVFVTDNEYSINGGTTWATLASSPPTTTYGIAFGNVSGTPTWIRVATSGVIQYNNNANGLPTGTWTAATETASGLLYAAAYGNGVFMAAGDDQKIWYSANGITFTGSTTTGLTGFRALLWDGTRWLAFGNGGLWYSTNNGDTWTRVGTLTFGSFPTAITYNGTTNGIYRAGGGSTNTIYWCNGDPTVSGNWVTQSTVANISISNGQLQYINGTWFASGLGVWRSSDSNVNVWIADTTTGRTGTLGGYAAGSNAVIFVSTAEVMRIGFSPFARYSIGLPADPTYGANTLTFAPSSGANANVAAVELGNLIVANRPTYSASYANSRVTVIDTNSGGDITGAFTVLVNTLSPNGTITLSVNDGANAAQDVITFTDPVTSATYQYSPAFNSNISNIVTDIGTSETLPDWLGSVFSSDTVRFTSNIPGFLPFSQLIDASITNGLSNGVTTTLAVTRTIDSYGYSGATVPGGNDTELQFNDNGSFAGTNGIYYNAATSLLSLPAVIERVFTTNTPMTGNIDYDVQNQGILYYNVNATANANINFRGYSALTLDNTLQVDDSVTVKLWNRNGGTAYLPVNYTIDGSNITPVWLNGAAPTAANANSTMQYTYTIVKTAANTYTVLASQQRFA